MKKDLLTIDDLSADEIWQLCKDTQIGADLSKGKKGSVCCLFFEDSSRTRISFLRAAQDLKRDCFDFQSKQSSLNKGEDIADSFELLQAYGVQTVVVRAGQSQQAWLKLAQNYPELSFINAGTGAHSHPTQALLDLFCLYEKFGSKLSGIKIGISGNLSHSRVASSWKRLAALLNLNITWISPSIWKPVDWADDYQWSDRLDDVLGSLDVVMALRVQRERLEEAESYDLHQFSKNFQIGPTKLGEKQFFMAPGPINWGIELNEELRVDPRSLVSRQLVAGYKVRRTLLQTL